MLTRNHGAGFTGYHILDHPGLIAPIESRPHRFDLHLVTLAEPSFEDAIVGSRDDVEVESPVDMVCMNITYAATGGCPETKARADDSLIGQSPVAHIAIPTGFHFAD